MYFCFWSFDPDTFSPAVYEQNVDWDSLIHDLESTVATIVEEMKEMKEAGVTIEGVDEYKDHISLYLTTSDPSVADKFGFDRDDEDDEEEEEAKGERN